MKLAKWMNSLIIDMATLILGIALTFAFAPYHFSLIAIIIPAVLLFIWLKETPKKAFWLGYIFGMGFFGAGVYWVYISVHDFGQVPAPLAVMITCGMVAILATYPALVGYCLNRFFPINNTVKILCAFPALWVTSEILRSMLFSGFAWLFIGYSQTDTPLRGYAPIFSVYGVSLVTIVLSGILLYSSSQINAKKYYPASVALLMGLLIWCSGEFLSWIPWTHTNTKPIPIALVQGAIPQELKWSNENLMLSLRRYDEMTQPLWGKYQIIIWPETAVPMTLQEASPFINLMDSRASTTKTTLITGIPIYIAANNSYRNAIVTLGKHKNVYSKTHLVPFGEYVPFGRWLFPLLNFMNIPTSNLMPGDFNQQPLTLGDIKIGPSICYEITFPELIKSNDPQLSFLLTITNDAWFGKSNAQAQHLQMAQMRAIELQRPVLIVSNDGITAIVGSQGKILSTIPPYEPGILKGEVYPMQGLTPWMKNGMDPILFVILILLGTTIFQTRFQLKKETELSATINENPSG